MRGLEKFVLPESQHAEVVAEAPVDRDHLLDRLRRYTPEMRPRYTIIVTYEERITYLEPLELFTAQLPQQLARAVSAKMRADAVARRDALGGRAVVRDADARLCAPTSQVHVIAVTESLHRDAR